LRDDAASAQFSRNSVSFTVHDVKASYEFHPRCACSDSEQGRSAKSISGPVWVDSRQSAAQASVPGSCGLCALVTRTGGVAATRFVAAETCPLARVAAASSRSVGTSVIICGSSQLAVPAGSQFGSHCRPRTAGASLGSSCPAYIRHHLPDRCQTLAAAATAHDPQAGCTIGRFNRRAWVNGQPAAAQPAIPKYI
jgi:hypothetical protein